MTGDPITEEYEPLVAALAGQTIVTAEYLDHATSQWTGYSEVILRFADRTIVIGSHGWHDISGLSIIEERSP